MRSGLTIILATLLAVGFIVSLALYFNVSSDVILGCVTALITVAGWLYTSQSNSTEAAQARLHPAKVLVYEKLFDIVSRQMGAAALDKKTNSDRDIEKLARELHEIRSKLLIWGSDTTLAAWLKVEEASDATKQIKAWGELFASMRRDLGHLDRQIGAQDLAVFFVRASDKKQFK